eukprot:gene29772-36867_t
MDVEDSDDDTVEKSVEIPPIARDSLAHPSLHPPLFVVGNEESERADIADGAATYACMYCSKAEAPDKNIIETKVRNMLVKEKSSENAFDDDPECDAMSDVSDNNHQEETGGLNMTDKDLYATRKRVYNLDMGVTSHRSRVQILTNIATSLGIYNGAVGTVVGFMFNEEEKAEED